MSTSLKLRDPGAARDLDTFLGRAAAVQDGSARLIADAGVLAVYVPVLFPTSLLDDSATVLGLRTFAIADAGLALDAIVPMASLRSRVQASAAAGDDVEVGVPLPVYSVSWAGIAPPRSGWVRLERAVPSEALATAAAAGMREVAEALPDNPGEAIVRQVRGAVWGEPIEGAEALPRGAAFAAQSLGFLPPDGEHEDGELFEIGPWTRLSLRRGHVLVKRRSWSLAR